jgi:hypothetical protein
MGDEAEGCSEGTVGHLGLLLIVAIVSGVSLGIIPLLISLVWRHDVWFELDQIQVMHTAD